MSRGSHLLFYSPTEALQFFKYMQCLTHLCWQPGLSRHVNLPSSWIGPCGSETHGPNWWLISSSSTCHTYWRGKDKVTAETFPFRKGKKGRHTAVTGPRQWWSLSGWSRRGSFKLVAGKLPWLDASSALCEALPCALFSVATESFFRAFIPHRHIYWAPGPLPRLANFHNLFLLLARGPADGIKIQRVQACGFFGNLVDFSVCFRCFRCKFCVSVTNPKFFLRQNSYDFIFVSLILSPHLVANLRPLEITDQLGESTPLIWLMPLSGS